MQSMEKSFYCWYVIGSYDYLCILHILLVGTCVSIHVLTSNASLLQSPKSIICSPWCIHLDISVLRSIQNWLLESFWIFLILMDYSCWLCVPTELSLTVGQYAVMILVITLFFPCISIHGQQTRFLNSWPVVITLHDNSYTSIIDVPLFWNVPSEMVTRLYPVIIHLVFNHPYVLLYIFYFMLILLQLLFTSASNMIDIPSFIVVFFKVSNSCWLSWSDELPIPPMIWNMILILPSLFSPLSRWPQSLLQFLLVFLSVMFGIPLWCHPLGCR